MLFLKLLGLVKAFSQELFSTSSCPSGFLKHHLLSFNLLTQNWKNVGCKLRLYRIWNRFVSAEVLLEVGVCSRRAFVSVWDACRWLPT